MQDILAVLENASGWDDIYEYILNKYSAEVYRAGKAFETFTKLYFLHEPEVCRHYKNVWLFDEVPTRIKAKLGLSNQDYGVDLILEDQENALHVVQCKFKKDQASSVSWTKDRLANVLAEGDKADFFVIFTNASRIDTHTLSKKKNKLRVFTVGDLLRISPQTIQAMQDYLLGNQPIEQPKKLPRDYQKTAIDKVIGGFEQNSRGQLILPCGTGKTLISLWIHEQLNPHYTLVLFPSLALLRQTKNEWSAHRTQYVPYICVCSEKDIDRKRDSTQVHLYEMSGVVSTNPDEIRTSLNKHKQLSDEAHKTAGSRKGLYGLIHDDSKIPVKKRLYMTATPRILGDNVKNRLSEEEVGYLADMSDTRTFGHEFYHMNFKTAIEKNILVDYKIIAMGVSDAEIAAVIRERHYMNDDVTIDEVANNYALEKFMKKHEAGHAITFHSSVAKAKSFQERHQELFQDTATFHVNGTQTTNERNVTLKEFEKSSKAVVTNARCLTEGVDIPVIDAVYFCDPKNSKIDIVQAAGRALRRADGKSLGYIVVPIFHHDRDDVEEAIEEGVFNNLVSVIRSLSSHDERLVDEIRAIKLGKGTRQPQSDHISMEGAVNLITIDNMGDLSDHLFDQVVSKFKLPWRPFEEARAFVQKLNLKSKTYWEDYCKTADKPADIPSKPGEVYKHQWMGWGNWLGTGRIADQLKQYKNFEEARIFVHKLKLKSREAWKLYCQNGDKPKDIPNAPDWVYKNKGWISWSDWLGANNIANKLKQFKSFEEARAFAHTLKIKTLKEWQLYAISGAKPDDIPSNPAHFYKNKGWSGWCDWLGTDNTATKLKQFKPFGEARAFVHTLSLRNHKDWITFCKSGNKPKDVPTNTQKHYKNKGWISWGDWLGTGKIGSGPISLSWRNFKDARAFVHLQGLKNRKEWTSFCKNGNKPKDIPSDPNRVYKDEGWMGWRDWLGNN